MTARIILFLVLILNTLYAEFYYSGKINIPYNFNLNTYKNTELPIRFIGAGEGIRDLRPFNSFEFVEALLSKR